MQSQAGIRRSLTVTVIVVIGPDLSVVFFGHEQDRLLQQLHAGMLSQRLLRPVTQQRRHVTKDQIRFSFFDMTHGFSLYLSRLRTYIRTTQSIKCGYADKNSLEGLGPGISEQDTGTSPAIF